MRRTDLLKRILYLSENIVFPVKAVELRGEEEGLARDTGGDEGFAFGELGAVVHRAVDGSVACLEGQELDRIGKNDRG